MREQWAKRIALVTGLLVLLLAITFANIQNPPAIMEHSAPAPLPAGLEATTLDPRQIDAGSQIYQQQGCARCHAIAGAGNRRYPLDGVGTRRTVAELHDWIVGAEAVRGGLSANVAELKQGYRGLSASDRDALVSYLQSLPED